MFPLALEIEDLVRFLPVIVIFVLMALGSLLGNANKQKKRRQPGGQGGRGGQSWEEILEQMMGGQTRTPPEPTQVEPPPLQRQEPRRPSPPPVPQRRPTKQKQRRSQPVRPAEVIEELVAPAIRTPAISAAAQLPDRPSEAGQVSAGRMAVVAAGVGSAEEAQTQRTAAGYAASASRARRWLTPATLRREFILTEILQPPVGLREDRPI